MKKLIVLLAVAGIAGTAHAGVWDDVAHFYIKQAGLDRLTAVLAPTAANKVLIDGKAMVVGGSSVCPEEPVPGSTGIWVMGMSNEQYADLYAGRDGCAVLGPKATSINVVLYDKVDGHVIERRETWAVQRGLPDHADAVVLKRPNGDFVVSAR